MGFIYIINPITNRFILIRYVLHIEGSDLSTVRTDTPKPDQNLTNYLAWLGKDSASKR